MRLLTPWIAKIIPIASCPPSKVHPQQQVYTGFIQEDSSSFWLLIFLSYNYCKEISVCVIIKNKAHEFNYILNKHNEVN